MLNLLLTGGEPILRPDFRDIYTGCRNLGLMVAINTNGTLIDDDMISFFAENPPARMNITLYGASGETYESLCGDASAYDRVIHAILGLKQAGILIKLNYSVTQYNRRDGKAIYEFARKHDLAIQPATYMFPPIRACEQGCFASDRMTPEEAAEAQIESDWFRMSPDELKRYWKAKLSGVRIPGPDDMCQELPTERIKCRAGRSTFWVTWDWKLRPCGMMTEPSADLSSHGFTEAWKQIREARNEIFVPSQCTSCEFAHACDQCPALCYAETGSFTEVPVYMCDKTKHYLRLIEKYISEIDTRYEKN